MTVNLLPNIGGDYRDKIPTTKGLKNAPGGGIAISFS